MKIYHLISGPIHTMISQEAQISQCF